MDGFRYDKNDRLDAVSLAMAMSQHHYQSAFKEKAVYGELHDLERTYQEFNEDIVRAKNRLHQKRCYLSYIYSIIQSIKHGKKP
ncbi:IS110 family transposase [Secundilactobacillus malefermentans]|uniref:IS110 family transposase n=1 Tax=Secundilactobacillus malefermentans TaxID=176292 RepID=UPI0021F08E91|nr:IS110 family transposase [Secundilactobacillus malefermentans]